MNAWSALAMLWPLGGAAQAVFTLWNLAKFQERTRPDEALSVDEPEASATPDPRNLAVKNLTDAPTESSDPRPLVSLLVPARNEASDIGECLRALLAQADIRCEILVLDDHSEDETATLAEALIQAAPHAKLLKSRPIEAGWTGKNWACSQLAEAATGEWLVFIDADTRLAPGAVAAALELAKAQQADMLSFVPRDAIATPAEGSLMPLPTFLLLSFFPVDWAQTHPDPQRATANGKFLIFSRRGYERCGGHAAVADSIAEARALAHAVKASGGQLLLRDAGPDAICRMYKSVKEIWEGFRKSAYPAFGSQPKPFALGLGLLLIWHVLPPFAVLVGLLLNWPGLTTAGIVQTLVLVVTRLVVSVRMGHPLWSPLLHPLAALFIVAVAVDSYRGWVQGDVMWKGRRYGGPPPLDLSQGTGIESPA